MKLTINRRRLVVRAAPAVAAMLAAGALVRLLAGGPVPRRGALRGGRTGVIWEARSGRRVAHHFVEFDVPPGRLGAVRVYGPWWPSAWGFTDGSHRRFRAGFRWPYNLPYPGTPRAWTLSFSTEGEAPGHARAGRPRGADVAEVTT